MAGWCITRLLEDGHEVVTTVRGPGREAEVRATIEAAHGSTARLEVATADLLSDDGWDEAMAGCEHVLHVASPLASGADPEEIVATARDGTLRVVAAAERAGVQRLVITSSCAAATPDAAQLTGSVDESCWTDVDEPGLSPYRRSKVVAERAAWDFVEQRGGPELVTILPAAVFGPSLSAGSIGSLRVIGSLLDGSAIALPRLGFEVVDVRDVAAAHLLALEAPAAAGQRFIVAGELLWFADIARILREHLGAAGGRVPRDELTDDDFRAITELSPELKNLLPLLGRELRHSAANARSILGWQPRPAVETVVDSARCLLDLGVIDGA